MYKIQLLSAISVFMFALSFETNAQDYYSKVDSLEYAGVKYRITHYPGDIYVENAGNYMRNELRYKLGSNPIVYYTYATGMGHLAESNTIKFNELVRKVFSENEIKEYTNSPDAVFLTYVVDPNDGEILEVSFRVRLYKGDKALLAIPIEKFYELEMLIKRHLVCHISDELRAERQSYTLGFNSMFVK